MCRTYKMTDELTSGTIVILGCGVVRLTTKENNSLGWCIWSYTTVYGTPSFPYLSGSEFTKWEVIAPL